METKDYLSYIVHEIHTKKHEGYTITNACIGCGSCTEVCPQNCIETGNIPYVIRQENCLHCGNCASVCPSGAVKRG